MSTTSKEPAENKKAAEVKIRGSDYRSWDKFDADQACEKMDEAEEMRTQADAAAERGDVQEDEEETESEEEDEEDVEKEMERMLELAEMHKDKGNTFFKKGDFASAIECYTKGMTADPSNAILPANRAMALLKSDRFGAALQDCEVALSLDPKYVKAKLRRAACFVGLGHIDDARKDYEEVLKLEPGNHQAKKELKTLPEKSSSTDQHIRHAPPPNRPRSQKPLFRMPIEEVGRPAAPVESSSKATPSSSIVSTGSREQPEAQPPKPGMSVSEWLAQDERVIRTHDLLSGAVESAMAPKQGASKEEMIDSQLSAASATITDTLKKVSASANGQRESTASSNGKAASATKTSSATTAAAAGSSRPLSVPKTAYQLAMDLRKLRNTPDDLYAYVKAIPVTSYAPILKQSLDSDILSALLHVYRDCYLSRHESVLKELTALSKVRRFDTAVMLLSSADQQVIHDLFQARDAAQDAESGDQLAALRTAYQA